MKDIITINGKNYEYHHTGSAYGYESRKPHKTPIDKHGRTLYGDFGETDWEHGRWIEYDGRFGKGYIHISPRWDTTQYINKHYYIEVEQ